LVQNERLNSAELHLDPVRTRCMIGGGNAVVEFKKLGRRLATGWLVVRMSVTALDNRTSNPASRLSAVDFPQPVGPTIEMTSLAARPLPAVWEEGLAYGCS
jgi:hypothetical protein